MYDLTYISLKYIVETNKNNFFSKNHITEKNLQSFVSQVFVKEFVNNSFVEPIIFHVHMVSWYCVQV